MKRLGVLTLILCAGVLFGCVSTQKYQQDMDAAQQKLNASEDEKGQLKREYEGINESLRGDNEMLQAERDRLGRELTDKERLLVTLRDELADGQVKISELEDHLTVRFVETLFFESGSAYLTKEGKRMLDGVAEALVGMAEKQITVEGHTDDRPIGSKLKATYASNWELSAARAIAVARYLAEKAGIPADRVAATGYGSHRPVVSNDTPEGRARNRRIEIMLSPLQRKVVPLEGYEADTEGKVL